MSVTLYKAGNSTAARLVAGAPAAAERIRKQQSKDENQSVGIKSTALEAHHSSPDRISPTAIPSSANSSLPEATKMFS
jgi:hypothetical protein